MSFDLGVWFEPGPITDQQATDKYDSLCDKEADSSIPAHPQVADFYRDLTRLLPELDSNAAPEEVERSPWTTALDTTPTSVVMGISWPRAVEVSNVVRELADRHGLIYYDPQAGTTSQPDFSGTGKRLSLSSCNGSRSVNPTPDRIAETLRQLSARNWFAVLQRDDDRYVQVGFGEQAGMHPEMYVLERRDGSAEDHYRTLAADIDKVITAFQSYAQADASWTSRFSWQKIEL